MVEKGIILELKEDFALAMEEGGGIVHIRRKKEMAVGDTIYILPEDICHTDKKGRVYSFADAAKDKKTRRMDTFRRLAAVAAMVALVCTLLLPHVTEQAYAVASFEGKNGVQIELDQKDRVIAAVSVDGKIRDEELAELKGRKVTDLGDDFVQLLGDGPILIGYASKNNHADTPQMEEKLRSLFARQDLIYFTGDWETVSDAATSGQSLGRYLMGLLMTAEDAEQLEQMYDKYQELYEDALEELEDEADRRPGRVPPGGQSLEEMSFEELMALAKQDATWMDDIGFQVALWDRVDDLDELHEDDPEDDDSADDEEGEEEDDDAEESDRD